MSTNQRVPGIFAIYALLACGPAEPNQDPATSGEDPTTSGSTTTTGVDGADSVTTDGSSEDSTTGEPMCDTEGCEDGSTTGDEGVCVIGGEPGRCLEPGYGGPGECDPYQQDCPDGLKCLPYDPDSQGVWDSTRCAPVVAEPAQLGEPCTMLAGPAAGGEDTCDVGLICWDLAGDQGICAEQCGCGVASATCQEQGTTCAVLNGGAVGVCRPACVPTDLDACGPDQVCVPTPSGLFQCLNAVDDAGEGESCGAANGCAAGLICAGPQNCVGNEPCCVSVCETDEPASCRSGCEPLFPGASPHECYDTLGLCPGG